MLLCFSFVLLLLCYKCCFFPLFCLSLNKITYVRFFHVANFVLFLMSRILSGIFYFIFMKFRIPRILYQNTFYWLLCRKNIPLIPSETSCTAISDVDV